MKRLLAYLFIIFGLGLVFNANVNAAKNKKVDYLCVSENKNNKKQYVKHSDDEFLFQVFYKNKLLNLQKNKVCTYKIFSTDPIFQGLFNTLTHKSIGRTVKIDSSWGITKIIKKTMFLDRFGILRKYAQKNERRNICISDGNQLKRKYKVYFKGQTFVYKNGKSETQSCKDNISISHYYYPNHYKKIKDLLYKKNQTEWGWKTFTKEEIINTLIETRILEDKKIQIAEKEPSKEQKINKKYIVKIIHCQDKDVVTDKFLQYSRASNYVRIKECKSGYNNQNKRNISHKAALALPYNQRYINRKNKNHFNYCFKENVGTIFPFNTEQYKFSPTFCSDNFAIKLEYDGKNYFYYSDKKSNIYAYDVSSIQKKDTKVAKIETDNIYSGVICARTNKHTWEANKPVEYRQIYIFNNKASCSSLNADRITYELFNKIKDNPQKYSKGWHYNVLKKKLRNKICLLPNGKINNLSNKCEELEKELYISEKSSGKSIILLPKNSKEKIQIAEKEPKKVEEPKQEEFKPKKTNQDKDPPIIEVAENITVSDSTYEIKGNVKDKSKKIFVEVDGQTIPVKKGKFKLKRYSPVDEQIKIVAIDQWGNRSKPKIVNVTIDIKNIEVAEKIEPLNPTKIRSKKNKDRIALIIGIEKYDQVPSASYANLDAKFFYEYVRKGFGVSKSNIKLLIDEDADLVKSLGTLNKWLPGKIKSDQTELIIFFAGHGLASNDGKELYILPQDSDPDLLDRTALSRTELFKQIINLNPKSVTMFMDTCYSGISRDEKMLLASARPIRIVANEEEGIPDNFTIFSASQLDQISSGIKEAKHGIFSYYLMKGLEGYADANKDKNITNGELLAYMDENVSQKASELGRQQNPSLTGDPNKVLMSY